VLVLAGTPSPQKNPVFDGLANSGLDIAVVYLSRASRKANWGNLRFNHRHEILSNDFLSAFRIFWTVLRSTILRVVICHGYRGPVRQAALLAARLRRLPIVTRSDTNIISVRQRSRVKATVQRLVYRTVFPQWTRVWTVGNSNEAFWRDHVGIHNTRRIPYSMPILPNSLNAPIVSRQSTPTEMNILFVGRLTAVKNIGTLIDAFHSLGSSQFAGWSLNIVGDGPMMSALQLRAESDSRIRIHGACPYNELDMFYRNSDVFVLPSTYEPWGLVSNEALCFGLRLLVSEQAGSAELINSPEDGETFPPTNTAALANALARSVDFLDRSPKIPYDPVSDMLDDINDLINEAACNA